MLTKKDIVTVSDAYKRGEKARLSGYSIYGNPFKTDQDLSNYWDYGWKEKDNELNKDLLI